MNVLSLKMPHMYNIEKEFHRWRIHHILILLYYLASNAFSLIYIFATFMILLSYFAQRGSLVVYLHTYSLASSSILGHPCNYNATAHAEQKPRMSQNLRVVSPTADFSVEDVAANEIFEKRENEKAKIKY